MKKISIAILLLLYWQAMQCQPSRSPLSERYTSMGTYSKNFADAFSGSSNQAALAQVKYAAAGVYGERRFMLKDLSNFAAAVVLPSHLGGFGISVNYFGGQYFSTSQTGIGYGKRLGDKLAIGLQFNYNRIRLAGYGSAGTITAEAGTLVQLTEKLRLGIHAYNPLGGKFGKLQNEKLASIYTAGFGYDASDKVFITAVISKEEDQPVNLQAALQYSLVHRFYTRLGMVTGTGSYFFGLGVQWKACRLDAVSTWQAQLGFTPGLMLLFNFHEPPQTQPD